MTNNSLCPAKRCGQGLERVRKSWQNRASVNWTQTSVRGRQEYVAKHTYASALSMQVVVWALTGDR